MQYALNTGVQIRKEGGGEEEARTDDHLDRGGGPPSSDVRPCRPGSTRHGPGEEALVESVVIHVPARDELAHHDGDEGDGILEAWTIIDRLRVSVDEIQAQRHDSGRD